MSGEPVAMTREAWPLRGLRVLDCCSEIAGPYATKLLVDAGADVIKVEPPAGDPLRHWTASRAPIPLSSREPWVSMVSSGCLRKRMTVEPSTEQSLSWT